MRRRDFLKLSACTPVLAFTDAHSRENHQPSAKAIGLLYDATLCINCQSCVSACKYVNQMAPDLTDSTEEEQDVWVINENLSSKTLSVVQRHQWGNGEHKNDPNEGFSFLKRQCMHCIDPSCVSACPVSAMRKDKDTGIVGYDAKACIGCRYCVAACPFGVPQFEYENPFGQIQKCQLCNQAGVERLDNGKLPACAEVCPVGATIYGPREALLKEAKKRLAMTAGTLYGYPLGQLDSGEVNTRPLASYQSHIYGEREGGGTQVLYLAAVPFEQLSLPKLSDNSAASRSERLQGQMTGSLPLIGLASLMYLSYRHRILPSLQRDSSINTEAPNGDEQA